MKARKFVSMLAASAAVLSVSVGAMLPTAASAQIGGVVFDPRNYAQNILTAARTLEQINNQIRQLQNQATSLVNEARNLQSLPLTVLEPPQAQIRPCSGRRSAWLTMSARSSASSRTTIARAR